MKRSGVKPGVHLTCRRFEDEIELFVDGCFLCEESKLLKVISHNRSRIRRKTGQRETSMLRQKRVPIPKGRMP